MGKLTIGNVTLDNNIILAPMAGVTDLPFRLLCKEQGAGLVCTEMISAKAILYKNKNTDALMEIHPEEMPVSLQLFGSDPDIISEMAKQIEEHPFSVLDINMGCPVPKVVNNGEGSALMKNPKRVGEIVSAVVKAIQKPVTVKIRSGFDAEHINAVEIAKIIEDSGAGAVAVHGRTREQFYAGAADWEVIAEVKNAVSIPVIGNGDITDGEGAAKMLHDTGC
ncbi:MAG: tRNA dihydrouridine synthase DusB, partial [Lachnospiraceae bacterium]|nr:tRNA dihydrouridine synthase DusB [Lachnospiraceae bacterium]